MLTPNLINLQLEISDVLFITGLLAKGNSEEEVQQFLASTTEANQKIVETKQEINAPGGGKLWIRYQSIQACQQAQAMLHQQSFKGLTIMARFELGFDPVTHKRRICKNSIHTTCIRRIQQRRGESNKNDHTTIIKQQPPANYSFKSLSIGEIEYPFPSGIYLTRLISLVQKMARLDDPLIELLSNNYVPPPPSNNQHVKKPQTKKQSTFGNTYAKEITESMAMVDASERALKLCLGRAASTFQNDKGCCVRVYCVGDGKYPITAAAMALNYPYPGWEFISIDPLSEHIDVSMTQHKLIQVQGKSQDYKIPTLPTSVSDDSSDKSQEEYSDITTYVDLVLACHSHAPLQEFWDRILKRRADDNTRCRSICITMHCCADFSDINQPPVLVFDDYEVYSPKREVRIYDDNISCKPISSP
jgi:hypothetical protein